MQEGSNKKSYSFFAVPLKYQERFAIQFEQNGEKWTFLEIHHGKFNLTAHFFILYGTILALQSNTKKSVWWTT